MARWRAGLVFGASLLLVGACFKDWDSIDPSLGTPPSEGGSSQGGEGGEGGQGAQGAAGGGGSGVCSPGEQIPCYTGDQGTENVGACVGGTTTCNDEGTGFGACVGEVTPATELCGNTEDDDCDGEVNEVDAGCTCTPGVLSDCYDGPTNTEDVGICVGGTKMCEASGDAETACIGQVIPLHEECLSADDDDCDSSANEGCPTGGIRFGGPEDGDTFPWGLAIDGADGYAIVGQTETASINFGGLDLGQIDTVDGFVARFDAADAHQWSIRVGGTGFDSINAVAMDTTGNVYIAGSFTTALTLVGCAALTSAGGEDAFVAKLDGGTGACDWAMQLVGDAADQRPLAIDVSGDGSEVVVAGTFSGTIDIGNVETADDADGFVVSLNGTTGAINWGKPFGTTNNDDVGFSVVLDGTDVILGGQFDTAVDFGGPALTVVGDNDGFIAKLDSSNNGAQVWLRQVAGNNNELVAQVAVDASGNVVATGIFSGGVDFGAGSTMTLGGNDYFVVKYDSAGTLLWEREYGGPGDQNPGPLEIDGNDEIWFGVSHELSADYGAGELLSLGSDDMALVKLDTSGNTIRSVRIGNTSDNDPRGIVARSDNSIIVVGDSESSLELTFGLAALSANGDESIVVAFLPP